MTETSAETVLPGHATDVAEQAARAAAYLKLLAHEGRLAILCHLTAGERPVRELEELVGMPQAAVSQQLARLRDDALVTARRDGKAVYYRLADPRTEEMIALLHRLFCGETR